MKHWPWWIWLLLALFALYIYNNASKSKTPPTVNDPRWKPVTKFTTNGPLFFPPQGTMEIIDSSGSWYKFPDGTIESQVFHMA